MKAITKAAAGKRWWPAALVAALAIVAILAAFAILTAPGRDAAEAQQSICETASGATLQHLIEAGVCAELTPSPTTSIAPTPTPTLTPVQMPTATQNPCDTATGYDLRNLIAAGACWPTTTMPLVTTPVPPSSGWESVVVVTTDTVPGRRIVQTHGMVKAVHIFLDDAQSNLMRRAASSGANGIVGFRWEVGDGAIIAYGTAVTIE